MHVCLQAQGLLRTWAAYEKSPGRRVLAKSSMCRVLARHYGNRNRSPAISRSVSSKLTLSKSTLTERDFRL